MLKRVRHCFILAFTAGLGLLLQAAESPANTLTDDEKKAGWVLLFDGKSLDHWRDPRKLDPPSDSWALEDGSIKALAHPRINEDLFSADTYRDFEFQWDWRISQGGNSGIKYRIQRTVWIAGEHPAIPRFEDEVEWFLDHPVTTRPSPKRHARAGGASSPRMRATTRYRRSPSTRSTWFAAC